MTILVGQRVTWLHTSRRGGVVTMTTREGIVERIEGATAYVRRGRRIESVDRNALLRPVGQKTALSELVEEVASACRLPDGQTTTPEALEGRAP